MDYFPFRRLRANRSKQSCLLLYFSAYIPSLSLYPGKDIAHVPNKLEGVDKLKTVKNAFFFRYVFVISKPVFLFLYVSPYIPLLSVSLF